MPNKGIASVVAGKTYSFIRRSLISFVRFRNLMKFGRIDGSCTAHDFTHCLPGDSDAFCQISLLFIFFFQFSLNIVCNDYIDIQHTIASSAYTYFQCALHHTIVTRVFWFQFGKDVITCVVYITRL